MSIEENLALVRDTIGQACLRAGRSINQVRLVAVSKYVDVERMAEAVAAGVTVFGENHAQEVAQKKTFFEQHAAAVHFIGHLQTNKIKYVCGQADLVESVDRINLAEALQQKAKALGVVQDVLIQINIGDEPQKGGIADVDLASFADAVGALPNLRLRGLMCVPPALDAEGSRPYFRRMRALFDRMQGGCFDTLSMGMSHDYAVAIEEGATEVRVGTAIFGTRDKK